MMKCDICKKREAVIFLQQVEPRKEIHLCFECANERGLHVDNERVELPFSALPALLSDLLPQKQPQPMEKTCPVCAHTLSQIQKTHTVGCPECYTFFAAEIKALQKKAGIEGSWTGTLPRRLGRLKSTLSDRVLLQTKLDESLAHEDYEKAAIYRDRLRMLEKASAAAAGDTA
jgi:protein arginine kinase activator